MSVRRGGCRWQRSKTNEISTGIACAATSLTGLDYVDRWQAEGPFKMRHVNVAATTQLQHHSFCNTTCNTDILSPADTRTQETIRWQALGPVEYAVIHTDETLYHHT